MTNVHVELVGSIDQLSAAEWNALNTTQSPFLRYEFLHALEASESVCADTGWQPCHSVGYADSGEPVASMPAYVKSHSYGEYVFDWSWANAYQRTGKDYYPKIVSAVPFSPVTGERLLLAPNAPITAEGFAGLSIDKFQQLSAQIEASSIHVLFPSLEQHRVLTQHDMLPRTDCQYHWFNESFSGFDDFLNQFTSRKRKNIRKERKRVQEQNIQLRQIEGPDISEQEWQDFYRFYHMTYYKRGGSGYLNQAFFEQIAATMADQMLMVLAQRDGASVGAALCFRDADTLYGRYWGCLEEYEFLHFEACYYQGIDYCIRQGIKRFDPGAQGQHKIARGFIPVFTHSNHWLAQPDFSAAVADFLHRETEHLEEYRLQACEMLPFNQQYLDNSQHQTPLKKGRF